MDRWYITLFGTLRVQRGEQVITRFRSQKVGGLLAYLAHDLRQPHPRELLVDIFWPESEPEAGRASLSTALSSLRNQLEPPGTPAGTVLRCDRFTIGLNPAAVRTDVRAFEEALRKASKTAARAPRLEHLHRAIDLYHGRLLSGYYEEWIAPEQERLAGLFFDATAALLGLLKEKGDLEAALRIARHAVSIDPLREEIRIRLMRLLAAAGQPAEAVREYREMERLLEQDGNGVPSAQLRAVLRQIEKRADQSALSLPPVSTPTAYQAAVASAAVSDDVPTTVNLLAASVRATEPDGDLAAGDASNTVLPVRRVLQQQLARFGGREATSANDHVVAIFPNPRVALSCAVAMLQALDEQQREPGRQAPTGIAIHTGDVRWRDGLLDGPGVDHLLRIAAAAHGGQILVSEAAAGLLRLDESEVRLMELGIWRLRDVPQPERLYQAETGVARAADFGPVRAEAGYQPHLPQRLTRFFGRSHEIDGVIRLVTGGSRLLTLTGPGGSGKSRLAIETADRLLDKFAGAIWFVPLADTQTPDRVPSAIREALRLPPSQVDPLRQAADALSRQPSLLLLDNFEHLVEGGADVVHTLLKLAPSLSVLVTSRQVLGLPAEQEFPVPPLPTPNGGHSPEQMSLYDSVRLFVDRAQAVVPHFQVTNYNAPAVAALCDRLEGIPLAIELAAARIQAFTPAQMLAQVENRFTFLASRKRGVEERHRTLRAAMEWSYRLLSPDVQRFFCRLSVFRGGWTVAAAEEVCEEPLALDLLALLRDCSLIEVRETERGMRFRMLETLREFGWEQLSSEQQTQCRRRHLRYLLAVAGEPGIPKPDTMEPEWLHQWEEELANVVTALDWSAVDAQSVEPALRLAIALGGFWWARDRVSVGFKYLTALLDAGGASLPARLRAAALQAAGGFIWENWPLSRTLLEQSLALSRQTDDPELIAGALQGLRVACVHLGKKDLAQTYLDEGLELSKQLGRMEQVAGAYLNLAYLARRRGDREESYALGSQAVTLWRAHGKSAVLPSYLIHLAHVAPDVSAAREHLQETLDISRSTGWKHGIACAYDGLGWIAYRQGDFKTAVSCFQECLTIWSGAYEGVVVLRASNLLSVALLGSGELGAAEALMMQNLAQGRKAADRYWTEISIEGMANIALAKQQWDRAARLFGAALPQPKWFESLCPPHSPLEREAPFAALKQALGPEAFAAAYEAGTRMTWEQTVALAMYEDPV